MNCRTLDYIYRTHQKPQLQFLGTWICSMCTWDPKIVWICSSILHGSFSSKNARTGVCQSSSSGTTGSSSTCQLNLKTAFFSSFMIKIITSSVFVYLCYNSEGKVTKCMIIMLWGRSQENDYFCSFSSEFFFVFLSPSIFIVRINTS